MRRAAAVFVVLLAGLGATPVASDSAAIKTSIAYVTGGARSAPEVWITKTGEGQPRELGEGFGPLVSPNGLMVAASDESTKSARGAALTLYSVSGGSPKSYFKLSSVSAIALAWSPDSRYLAVALSNVHLPGTKGSGLAIIDTQSGTFKMIATGSIDGASFEPGSSDMLVYGRGSSLSPTANINIFTVAADGSERTQITTNGRSSNPVWGSKGIAFDHEERRPEYAPLDQIWTMDANGSNARQITHVKVGPLVEGLVPLAFSEDGTRLAAEYEGEDTSIGYSVSLTSGKVTELKVGTELTSAWGISRDGSSILITLGGFEEPANGGKIEQIPFSGGQPTVLIQRGDDPSWTG